MNRYLLKSAIVAALGGLLFGFDTVVISGAVGALKDLFHLTPVLLGITVAAALVGTVLGSMFAAAPSDRYGRRECLQALAVLYVIIAIGCAVAWDWYSFVFFRFIGGLAIGGSSVIGPMYIAEIAPAAKRGRLVGLFQFNIVSGILLAYLSNYLIGTVASARRNGAGSSASPPSPPCCFSSPSSAFPRVPDGWCAADSSPKPARFYAASASPSPIRKSPISCAPSRPKTALASSRSFRAGTGGPSCWRSRSACSTSFPASMRSCTT